MIGLKSSSMPAPYFLEKADDYNYNIIFNTNVHETNLDDTTSIDKYSYDSYILKINDRPDIAAYIADNYDNLLNMAKASDLSAVSNNVRKIRDSLLQESDAHVLLDRLGLEIPSGDTFTAWKPFLNELASAVSGEWATYRQALRDVPQQEGFPYNVTWPIKPEE